MLKNSIKCKYLKTTYEKKFDLKTAGTMAEY